MRHIPEEELHAYLDQALSRSQCVEIESHLAECLACRGRRDSIAALRDRTTALLATLAPRRAVTPPFELIEARQAAAAARRHHRIRRAVWAASMVLAVGAGWGLNHLADAGPARQTADATMRLGDAPGESFRTASSDPAEVEPASGMDLVVADSVAPAEGAPAPSGTDRRPAAGRRDASEPSRHASAATSAPSGARFTVPSRLQDDAVDAGTVLERRFAAPQSLQVSSSGLSDGLALEGVWRTLSWETAQEEAGGSPAHVDGLPVVQVQVQQAASGKPLMVVAQQLGTGDVIRTIEGPAADVSSLLRRTAKPGSSPWPTVEPGDGGTVTSTDGSIVTMQGDRILAISAPGMSSDSLAAIARRVNAARSGAP